MQGFREYIGKCERDILTESWKSYDTQVAHLYYRKVPVTYIKQEMGLSYGEIYRSLERNGISPNRRTKPQHADVIYFGRTGMELQEISKLTGYSTRQVRNILRLSYLTD